MSHHGPSVINNKILSDLFHLIFLQNKHIAHWKEFTWTAIFLLSKTGTHRSQICYWFFVRIIVTKRNRILVSYMHPPTISSDLVFDTLRQIKDLVKTGKIWCNITYSLVWVKRLYIYDNYQTGHLAQYIHMNREIGQKCWMSRI